MADVVLTNRAPVLTLWGAVVAERMGYDWEAALTLGKCLAGLNAQTKGRMLGIYGQPKPAHGGPPKKVGLGEDFWIDLCGRGLPAKNTKDGVRAVVKDQPIDPAGVETYLEGKFGADCARVREAMTRLARAFEPEALDEAAYELYERFRPAVTHVGALEAIFRHALQIEPERPRRFTVSNASVNIVFRDQDRWILETWGETAPEGL